MNDMIAHNSEGDFLCAVWACESPFFKTFLCLQETQFFVIVMKDISSTAAVEVKAQTDQMHSKNIKHTYTC